MSIRSASTGELHEAKSRGKHRCLIVEYNGVRVQ
jgi:hypothetical protein